ncbi:hypothetical protein [Microseira sp. BLCC-F43]|jgi:hypothetical protein|uniref:hypothetical protein n=1 Tax=Microseira sp. BLCC-F43 TaxID=3153602 RepID=UPI0035BB7D47
MKEITQSDPNPEIEFSEVLPVTGEGLTLLLPLAAPAIAWVARATWEAIAERRKAKVEEEVDVREYLQQQNNLLLRELLDDRSDDSKAQ